MNDLDLLLSSLDFPLGLQDLLDQLYFFEFITSFTSYYTSLLAGWLAEKVREGWSLIQDFTFLSYLLLGLACEDWLRVWLK